jgi:hypothetical protein
MDPGITQRAVRSGPPEDILPKMCLIGALETAGTAGKYNIPAHVCQWQPDADAAKDEKCDDAQDDVESLVRLFARSGCRLNHGISSSDRYFQVNG